MTAEEQRKIREAHDALPVACRSKPATEAALRAFEEQFGPIPADYRWYLAECGGGVVHSEWLDDIDALKKSHLNFRAEAAHPGGWTKKDGFLIGWDGGGNPMIIDRETGQVVVEDHDFGGVHVEARSFVDFCLKRG